MKAVVFVLMDEIFHHYYQHIMAIIFQRLFLQYRNNVLTIDTQDLMHGEL